MAVQERIRRRRELMGLSQAELAKLVGMSQGNLSRLERRSGDMLVDTVYLVADALGCRPSELIE